MQEKQHSSQERFSSFLCPFSMASSSKNPQGEVVRTALFGEFERELYKKIMHDTSTSSFIPLSWKTLTNRCLHRIRRKRSCDDEDDEPFYIPKRMPQGKRHPGFLPIRLFCIMTLMEKAFTGSLEYDCLDLFAGQRAISKAFVKEGYHSCALDIAIDRRDAA